MSRKKPAPEGHLNKPEDQAWNEWFKGLDVKEHEKHLAQLGLNKEDIAEWEEAEGIKKKPAKKK
tara:strand:+ start:170 stop:361 length:192 start_codon:yes stop_codon:yes gene_type:complete